MKIATGLLPSPYDLAVWGQGMPLVVPEVQQAAHLGQIKYDQLQPAEDHRSVALHTRRAAYFYLSADKTPLRVRVHRTPAGEPYLWIEDGFHRLAGALARGDAEIEIQPNAAVIAYLRNRNAMNETAVNTESNLRQAIVGGLKMGIKGLLVPLLVGLIVWVFTYPKGAIDCHYYAQNKQLEGHYSWWECYVKADGTWYTKQEYQSAKIGALLRVDKPSPLAEAVQ